MSRTERAQHYLRDYLPPIIWVAIFPLAALVAAIACLFIPPVLAKKWNLY